jgi:predicted transcriptional regulator of viral defense system
MMARRGTVERVRRGVYRLSRFPESSMGQYMEAILWPHSAQGVISHESALGLYDMSDVNPTVVHITLPSAYRVRRSIPRFLLVHHADLEPSDITTLEGLPLTTPERTIRDCASTHLSAALLRQAIHDGSRSEHLSRNQAAKLELELFGSTSLSEAR